MKKTEIRRGDIFSYDFGTRIGSIQSGVRPVLVIQADNSMRMRLLLLLRPLRV